MDEERSISIAKLNDRFRKYGREFTVTRGVHELGMHAVAELLNEVRDFDSFDENNDPHGEHDFGRIFWNGRKVFWKIDYYDKDLRYGEDPLSLECRRILIIMLADEY